MGQSELEEATMVPRGVLAESALSIWRCPAFG
jgi:hypothetical protein